MPKDKVSKALRKYTTLQKQVASNTALLKQTVEGKQIYNSGAAPLATANTFNKFAVMDGLARGVADTGSGAGVADGARVGNSINVKSITCRMLLDGQSLGVSPTNPRGKSTGIYRLIIYNSPCGEDLDQTHLLREHANTEAALKSHYQINVAQGKMYEIWYDKVFCIDDAHTCKNIDYTKKWKNGKQVFYNGNVTAPSNFRPQVMLIEVNGDNLNTFHYSFKVKYEDL